ncbi:MAG: hypothetical protein WCG50_12770 [Rhodoferax sp.]|uniref:hypothetical protein n=1 Tax=Rhodoferax sp. TaxID=50421 RepID=UPI0030186582
MNTLFLFEVFQFFTITTLVIGCTIYCLLTLSPNVIKQALKLFLLRMPLPAFFRSKLQQNKASGACGSNCGGCSSQAGAPQPIKWHTSKH